MHDQKCVCSGNLGKIYLVLVAFVDQCYLLDAMPHHWLQGDLLQVLRI